MKHITCELHFRRTQWIIDWKHQFCRKYATFEASSFRSPVIKYQNSTENIKIASNKYQGNTDVIRASHSKKLSSLTGPATIPSGGFVTNSASWGTYVINILFIFYESKTAKYLNQKFFILTFIFCHKSTQRCTSHYENKPLI